MKLGDELFEQLVGNLEIPFLRVQSAMKDLLTCWVGNWIRMDNVRAAGVQRFEHIRCQMADWLLTSDKWALWKFNLFRY